MSKQERWHTSYDKEDSSPKSYYKHSDDHNNERLRYRTFYPSNHPRKR